MRGLTVRQPWAWAIAHGGKTIENRASNHTYRGPIAIHAGMAWSNRGMRDARVRKAWSGAGLPTVRVGDGPGRWMYDAASRVEVPYGAIVAVAELADVHPDAHCCRPWGESEYAEAGGRVRTAIHHLVLENIRRLDTPFECRGMLGLWNVPEDIAELITKEAS